MQKPSPLPMRAAPGNKDPKAMPNYVQNRVTAPRVVLAAMAKNDEIAALEAVVPYPDGLFMGNADGGISTLAEDCAEKAFNEPLSDNPLIRALEASNKTKWSAADLTDDGFEDFLAMCRSKKATGFYHVIDFCTKEWGTKWGALRPGMDGDTLTFETAWSTPRPIWMTLSATHPGAEIVVQYADEDLGSNCGTITLRGGQVVHEQPGDLTFAHDVWKHDQEYREEYAAEMAECEAT